jgi:hypothetical protein
VRERQASWSPQRCGKDRFGLPHRQGAALPGRRPWPVRSPRRVRLPRLRGGWELRSGKAAPARLAAWSIGRAPPLGDRNRTDRGLEPGSGHPVIVLPLSPQYRQYRRTSHSRPDQRRTGIAAARSAWSSAGIEPATPSLPSMVGWFTMPHSASHPHTTAQVRGAVGGCVMGQSEVAHSAVSGKSLARAPGWSSMGTNADANRPSSPRPQATGSSDALLSITMRTRAEAIRRRRLRRPLPQRLPPPGAVPTRPVTSSSTEQSRDAGASGEPLGCRRNAI